MEESRKELTIFENCPSLEYVINGFTIQDLFYVGIISGGGFLTAFLIYFITKNTIPAVFVFAVIASFAIMFLRRDRYLENCIDKIKILRSYIKSQKEYEYKYVNIYESEEDE